MTWGEPPAAVKEKIEQLKTKAAAKGRTLSYGIRLHVIVRETNEAAWQAADELLSHVNDDTIAAAQAKFAQMDSVGQQRMAALHGGRRDNLEISPNLWAGDWTGTWWRRHRTGGRPTNCCRAYSRVCRFGH